MTSINTNLAAFSAQRNISKTTMQSASSLAKLSSGLRVPTAKDDAAALAIGSRLNLEGVALRQAGLNAAQAGSLLQIADGAMGQIGDILTRMQSLAVQSSSGQLSSVERSILNTEFSQLQAEIDRIATDTKFNGVQLLAGSSNTVANFTELAPTASTDAKDLLGEGIANVDFGESFGDGGISIEYNGTAGGREMTITNLVTGAKETATLTSTTLTAGQTEDVRFGQLDIVVTINSEFNKTAAVTATNTVSASAAAADLAVTNDGALTQTDAVVDATGQDTPTGVSFSVTTNTSASLANQLTASDLVGGVLTIDGGIGSGTSAATVVTLTGVSGHTFTATGLTDVDASNSTIDVTFTDEHGNTVQAVLTLEAAFAGDNDRAVFDIDLGSRGGSPAIEANSFEITSQVLGSSITSSFVGNINEGTISFNMANAAAAVASINLDGNGAFTATVDLSSAGTKTMTLTRGTGATEESLVVEFVVTEAFENGDSLSIELGELGKLVGSESATASKAFDFQIGTGTITAQDTVSLTISDVTGSALGVNAGSIGIDTQANALLAIDAIAASVDTLNTARATVGAAQNRLDFASNNIAVTTENTEAARSGLLDVNVSTEMTNFTSKQVLLQAGISMLAQANQQPALLLRLLQ